MCFHPANICSSLSINPVQTSQQDLILLESGDFKTFTTNFLLCSDIKKNQLRTYIASRGNTICSWILNWCPPTSPLWGLKVCVTPNLVPEVVCLSGSRSSEKITLESFSTEFLLKSLKILHVRSDMSNLAFVQSSALWLSSSLLTTQLVLRFQKLQ